MSRRLLTAAGLALALFVPAVASAQTEPTDQRPIYGSQLMNEQERFEYRQRMRSAASDTEREQIRMEHHQAMQERAQRMGVTLPDEPPARGMGQGMGRGMGPGQGMGPGMGQGTGPGQGMGSAQGMGPGQGMGRGQGMGPGQGMGQGMGPGGGQRQ